ncbi:hypothetical protein H8959_013392 [Pygathrix nigripes]
MLHEHLSTCLIMHSAPSRSLSPQLPLPARARLSDPCADPSLLRDLSVLRGKSEAGRSTCPTASPKPPSPSPSCRVLTSSSPRAHGLLEGLRMRMSQRGDPRPRPLGISAQPSRQGDQQTAARSDPGGASAPRTAQDLHSSPFAFSDRDGELGERDSQYCALSSAPAQDLTSSGAAVPWGNSGKLVGRLRSGACCAQKADSGSPALVALVALPSPPMRLLRVALRRAPRAPVRDRTHRILAPP